ncbi:MAG: hypothetical protein EOO75_10030, partial [Myxococcales bacterium]
GCATCRTGYHEVDRGDDDLATVGFPSSGSGFECVRDLTCAGRSCGPGGTCVEGPTGASCLCAPGLAGEQCESCAPPFERAASGACVLGEPCAERRCGGHGSCVAGARGEVTCACDTGWDIDAACGGRSIALGGPEEAVGSRAPARLHVGLRNGAHCAGDFVWSVPDGGGTVQPDPADSTWATYTAPLAGPRLGRARVRAVCAGDPGLDATRDLPLASSGNTTARPQRVTGSCPSALAAEIDPVMIDWMEANGIPGGTIGVSVLGGPVCLRAYGYRSLGTSTDGGGGREAMRTCTPMRMASVTKMFTRSALRAHLYGAALPASMGGGTLGPATALLPIVDTTMDLGPGNLPTWNEPASLYAPGWTSALPDGHCTPGAAPLDPAWRLATVDGTLRHRAGFQPNQSYQLGNNLGCNELPAGTCKDFNRISDPTVAAATPVRVANDLGLLDHGVARIDDVMAWMGGVCMYDSQANNRYRYSNFGYSAVGRALELIAGQPYEDYVLDFLEADDIIDRTFANAGRPIVYQGQNLGNGPGDFALPSYMREARYYSHLGKLTDVTKAVKKNGQWTFPAQVDAPYGGANYDLMYAHGGLVANSLALLNFARVYRPSDGQRRPKIFLPVHDNTTMGGQNGLLWGTFADLNEFDDAEPNRAGVKGCY